MTMLATIIQNVQLSPQQFDDVRKTLVQVCVLGQDLWFPFYAMETAVVFIVGARQKMRVPISPSYAAIRQK